MKTDPLTYDMANHIHNSNLIENIDSEREDAQSLQAWSFLIMHPQLTHGVICQLQKMITINQSHLAPDQRGYYRDRSQINVTVGRRTCPAYQDVPHMMDDWILGQHRDPKAQHIKFEVIHPFVDGNGRTGRMLMWWMEFKQGKEPTLLDIEERQKYYGWFS